MNAQAAAPAQISLDQWDARYVQLKAKGMSWPWYVGPLRRCVDEGDLRLPHFLYDNSPAAFRLWNFLLTEEQRLNEARQAGQKIVGTMKDLGTVPVMAYSLPGVRAFYPDGAWWVPCIMQLSSGDLQLADRLGIDESFCPVRAMLGAFVQQAHFPRPDLLISSAGATCDDFSAIVQRLSALGHPVLWWEVPHRRRPEAGEDAVELPGGMVAPASQVRFVRGQLQRVREALAKLATTELDDDLLAEGIRQANRFRLVLRELRELVYKADPCPMGALEMLIAEMLAVHFCSDRPEAIAVLEDLLGEVRRRVQAGQGVLPSGALKVFWVNPVADLRVMNLLEQSGGRLGGADFMFSHAIDAIPENIEPVEALARMALADPMVGPSSDRAERICRDALAMGARGMVISRIPGASHCGYESAIIGDLIRRRLELPVADVEVPPVSDSMQSAIRTRLEALVESARGASR